MNPGIWAGAVCVAPFFAYLKWKQTRGVWNNDAWAHCVVSCMAARSCTTLIAALGGVAKEFVDCVEVKLGWHGEWSDYMANAAGLACAGPAAVILPPGVGTLICLLQESCEDCCDRKYSRNV